MKYVIEYETERLNISDGIQVYGNYETLDVAIKELDKFYDVSSKFPIEGFKRIFRIIEKNSNDSRILKVLTLKI